MKSNAELAAETLQNFFDQFGSDVYGKTLLTVLLQGLKNEETLFLFGEQSQDGHQISNSIASGQGCGLGVGESKGSEAPGRMGKRDPEDYL